MIDPAKIAEQGSEHAHQVALFCWAGNEQATYPELMSMFAIPNGGKRDKIQAANLKAEGVKAGVPDILLPVCRHGFHGLFIELKRLGDTEKKQRKGKTSEKQDDFHAMLIANGYVVATCFGFHHAKDTLISYLTTKQPT